MDYDVEISLEHRRLCGWRKADKSGVGIYLMGGRRFEPCERLPWPLSVCPICGEGIRPARSYRWIDPRVLFNPVTEPKCTGLPISHRHAICPVCNPREGRAMLMWVGEKYYRTPDNFTQEAQDWGISKKVVSMPLGLEIGKTVVFLAHIRAILEADREPMAGIFSYFVPQGVDLVIEEPDHIPDRAKTLKDKLVDKARIVVVERSQ